MARVFLGLGANTGDRGENVRRALQILKTRCQIVAISSLYESKALVPEGEPPGPDYLNAACEASTDLTPAELLRFVKQVERELGRRPARRWAPRPIDIDILLYDDAVIETEELTVPHPAMPQRSFVLIPLAEIAPRFEHPVLRRTFSALAAEVAGNDVRRLAAAPKDAAR